MDNLKHRNQQCLQCPQPKKMGPLRLKLQRNQPQLQKCPRFSLLDEKHIVERHLNYMEVEKWLMKQGRKSF